MKTFVIFFYLFFLSSYGIVSGTVIAEDTISVEIHVLNNNVALGDSLTLFCTVSITDGLLSGEPELWNEPVFFDIQKKWQESSPPGSNPSQTRYAYLLYVFSPDTLRVGPFIVPYVTAAGDTALAESNSLTLLVSGLVDNPQTPPQPNRDPLKIASHGVPGWMIILLAIIFMVLLAGIILSRRKKTPEKKIVAEPIDELGEFERIRKLQLYEAGRIKDLYILVSFALRGFIHRNMEFDALYETTGEIVRNLQRTCRDTQITEAIREVLEESDNVKFAKYQPPNELAVSIINRAYEPVKKVLDEISRIQESEQSEQGETVNKVDGEVTGEIRGGN